MLLLSSTSLFPRTCKAWQLGVWLWQDLPSQALRLQGLGERGNTPRVSLSGSANPDLSEVEEDGEFISHRLSARLVQGWGALRLSRGCAEGFGSWKQGWKSAFI